MTKDKVVDLIDIDLLNSVKVKDLINNLNQIYSNVGEIRDQIVITRSPNESVEKYYGKIAEGI